MRSENRPIRLLIIDGHARYRAELRRLLQEEPDMEISGEAEDSCSLVPLAASLRPDVILLDIKLIGGGDAALLRKVTATRPGIGVVMMTSDTDDEAVLNSLRAGAMANISKFSSPAEFARVIRCVFHGGVWIDTYTTALILKEIRQSS